MPLKYIGNLLKKKKGYDQQIKTAMLKPLMDDLFKKKLDKLHQPL